MAAQYVNNSAASRLMINIEDQEIFATKLKDINFHIRTLKRKKGTTFSHN
jgi:hypothetical protein